MTFAAGDTSQSITVHVIGDAVDEANETINITLSGAVNASIGAATGTGAILDDDAGPTVELTLNHASIVAGNLSTVIDHYDLPNLPGYFSKQGKSIMKIAVVDYDGGDFTGG